MRALVDNSKAKISGEKKDAHKFIYLLVLAAVLTNHFSLYSIT